MKRHHCLLNSFNVLACAAGLCSLTAYGQGNEGSVQRFRPGEWDLSPFATYVDKVGDNWGVGASATYFLTKNIGVGACTYWTDFSGEFFDNMSGEAYFRLPIGGTIAPYAVGSAGYVFETDEWSTTIGGGVDFRVFQHLSAFGDIQWRYAEDTRDGAFLRLGARLAF